MKFTIHFPFPSEWRKEFILFLLVFLTNKHSDFTCIYLFIDKFLSFIYTQKTKKSKLSSHRFILYWPIIKIDMENEKKKLAYCIFTWARVLWQGMFNFHTSLKSAFSLLIPVYTKPVSGTVTFFTFPSFLLASSKRTLIRKSIHFLVNWISTSYIPSFVLSCAISRLGANLLPSPFQSTF